METWVMNDGEGKILPTNVTICYFGKGCDVGSHEEFSLNLRWSVMRAKIPVLCLLYTGLRQNAIPFLDL
jgi:hypothetical protein